MLNMLLGMVGICGSVLHLISRFNCTEDEHYHLLVLIF
jgi:hypothetical protein